MQLCRSNASTAVCLPTDPRVAIAPTRIYDHMRYSKLNDARRRLSRGSNNCNNDRAVTLPMVTKTERSTRKQMATCANVYVVPSTATSSSSSSSSSAVHAHDYEQAFRVVVLRVSIHCQGCAAKVKKHISKMEGVTSYSIDLESKRVTVMGHVSPAVVLENISKIKKAELWVS